jgi:excisionase family DNA binding protein
MPEDLVSVGEAAKIAGVTSTTIDRWINAGHLEAVTMPPAYRRKGIKRYVRRADVERLAQSEDWRQRRRPRRVREAEQ